MYQTLPGPDRAYRYIAAFSLWAAHFLVIYVMVTALGQLWGPVALVVYVCLTSYLVSEYGKLVCHHIDSYNAKVLGLSVIFGIAQIVFWRTYKHP